MGDASVMRQWRKRWPTGTALAAKDSLPMRESISRFVASCLVLHLSSSCVSSVRLVWWQANLLFHRVQDEAKE